MLMPDAGDEWAQVFLLEDQLGATVEFELRWRSDRRAGRHRGRAERQACLRAAEVPSALGTIPEPRESPAMAVHRCVAARTR